jgi:hypothetical protein
MIVVVPQGLVSSASPYSSDKPALKIVSRIVCDQIRDCAKYLSKNQRCGRPRNVQAIFGSWVNFPAKDLKDIVGGYRSVCQSLENDHVIVRNPHYSNFPGKRFPYSYRLHNSLWKDELTLWGIPQRLIKKKFHCVVGSGGGRFNEEYRAAESHLGAFSLCDGDVPRLDALCGLSPWPDLTRQAVARLFSKSWWSTVDDNGRYHTPLTNLSKAIRGELVCECESVVGFDFANFQPSLLTLQEAFPVPEIEAKRYADLCREGRIYDHMLASCPIYTDRDAVKRDFQRMLNDRNERMAQMPLFDAFQDEFPSYAQAFLRIKQDDHCHMARLLQGLESEIMFGDVVRSFRRITKAPFFTVHDAIYTKNSQANILRTVLEDVIRSRCIPTIIKREQRQHPSPSSTPTINVGMNTGSGIFPNHSLIV